MRCIGCNSLGYGNARFTGGCYRLFTGCCKGQFTGCCHGIDHWMLQRAIHWCFRGQFTGVAEGNSLEDPLGDFTGCCTGHCGSSRDVFSLVVPMGLLTV
eukprot:6491957-Amphidinium_carterae.1